MLEISQIDIYYFLITISGCTIFIALSFFIKRIMHINCHLRWFLIFLGFSTPVLFGFLMYPSLDAEFLRKSKYYEKSHALNKHEREWFGFSPKGYKDAYSLCGIVGCVVAVNAKINEKTD